MCRRRSRYGRIAAELAERSRRRGGAARSGHAALRLYPVEMLARVTSATPWGIEARPVEVEVDVQTGLPQIQIVGLPDAAVRESRERVRSALRNCGFDLPPRAVTVNLAPADLRKEGNHLDLAIALALLAAHGALPPRALGRRRWCSASSASTASCVRCAARSRSPMPRRVSAPASCSCPPPNAGEAAALERAACRVGVEQRSEALGASSRRAAPRCPPGRPTLTAASAQPAVDLAEVRGQEVAEAGARGRRRRRAQPAPHRAARRRQDPARPRAARRSCRRSPAARRSR